jgi:hypothetical protein
MILWISLVSLIWENLLVTQDNALPKQNLILDLDALRNAYFEKYTSNYDLNDYIRLIKFFDNSLFKMIKTLLLLEHL